MMSNCKMLKVSDSIKALLAGRDSGFDVTSSLTSKTAHATLRKFLPPVLRGETILNWGPKTEFAFKDLFFKVQALFLIPIERFFQANSYKVVIKRINAHTTDIMKVLLAEAGVPLTPYGYGLDDLRDPLRFLTRGNEFPPYQDRDWATEGMRTLYKEGFPALKPNCPPLWAWMIKRQALIDLRII
jgi:hypothetical protein